VSPTELASLGAAGGKDAEVVTLSEIVQACRVLHAASLTTTVWGFVAVRDASGRGAWVTRDNVGLDEVNIDDIVLVSSEGKLVQGVFEPDSEHALALEVMVSRQDVHAVVHVHSLHATAFAATNRALHAISHEGCHLVPPEVVRGRFADNPGTRPDEGGEVVASLGLRNSILMPGHGLVTVAETLGEAVALAIYLEKACQLQLLAGDEVHTIPDVEVIEKRMGQLSRPRISWEYLQRVSPMTREELV
jgi:ribulose-5-phosphate 4-epimerase/fuculose-1-phosphate aldolase